MAIANGTCVSFCNQPRHIICYLTRVTQVCHCLQPIFGCRHLATSRESKAHFASPRYAPGTIAVNVTWMERGFNACQTHRSMYPSIFNRFPEIQPASSKDLHFSTFFAHFRLPWWVRPWDNRSKCYMNRKRIQCLSNASQHVPSISSTVSQ